MYRIVELRTLSQVDDLIPLTVEQHSHAYPHLPYVEKAVRDTFEVVLKDTSRTFFNCYLCYKKDELIGYCLTSRIKYYFNDDFYSNLEMWFVSHQFRGTRAAIYLIKAYERWSKLNYCVEAWSSVGVPNVREADKTAELLQKFGYHPMGKVLTKGN